MTETELHLRWRGSDQRVMTSPGLSRSDFANGHLQTVAIPAIIGTFMSSNSGFHLGATARAGAESAPTVKSSTSAPAVRMSSRKGMRSWIFSSVRPPAGHRPGSALRCQGLRSGEAAVVFVAEQRRLQLASPGQYFHSIRVKRRDWSNSVISISVKSRFVSGRLAETAEQTIHQRQAQPRQHDQQGHAPLSRSVLNSVMWVEPAQATR